MERCKKNRVRMKEILHNILPFVLIQLIDEYLKESFLVAIGGFSYRKDVSVTCNIFNNEKKQWEYFSPLPKEIWGAFLIQVKTKLFLIGGFNSYSCFVCDLSVTKKEVIWEEKGKSPVTRTLPFGFYFEEFIYIFGGFNLDEGGQMHPLLNGEKYNIKTNQWIPLSNPLPCKEFCWAIAVIKTFKKNQSIYAFAHKNPKQFQAEYNIITDRWNRITLSEINFRSSTSICFPPTSGMYFKYPYVYTIRGEKFPEVLLYKLDNNSINISDFASNCTGYCVAVLPNKNNLLKDEDDMLVLDSDGTLHAIHPYVNQSETFSKFQISRRKYSCLWIDI